MWLFDFVYLFKRFTSDDFFDLLEVLQSDITSGFHFPDKDLQISGNYFQDVGSAVCFLSYIMIAS